MQETITINTEALEIESKAVVVLSEKTQQIAISNQRHYESAALSLKGIKGKWKELDSLRKSITRPLDESKKKIMDLFRAPQDLLSEAEKILKSKMITYSTEQDRIRQEEQKKLEAKAEKERQKKEEQQWAWEEKERKLREAGKAAEADRAAEKAEERAAEAEEVVAPVAASRVEKTEGVSYRDEWYAEVTDFTALPDVYKLPDMTKLNKQAKATKSTVPVPGVVFKSKKVLASRF